MTARRLTILSILAGTALIVLPAFARPDIRFIWNASASVPVGLYRIVPADRIEVTDLAWTNVTAIQCSVATARIIIADIEQARAQSDDAAFAASCTAAIDAIEMAIIDSAPRPHQPDADRSTDMRTLTRAPHTADDVRRDR